MSKTTCNGDVMAKGSLKIRTCENIFENQNSDLGDDIWAFEIKILENAKGRHPFENTFNLLHKVKTSSGVLSYLSQIEKFVENNADGFMNKIKLEKYEVLKSIKNEMFKSFINSCLEFDGAKRWNAERLLNRPFLVGVEGYSVDCLKEYLNEFKKELILNYCLSLAKEGGKY